MAGFAGLEVLPSAARLSLPRAVSIAAALEPSVIDGIAGGPTQAYFDEYLRANGLLALLADEAAGIIRHAGFAALALRPTTEGYDRERLADVFPHKTAATRAGLGWIGRSALLVTPGFGAAVRLATVLTDAPLPVDPPVESSRCGTCDRCVKACPAGAPTGREWFPGIAREELFDAFRCQAICRQLSGRAGIPATICGICLRSCPWTAAYLGKHTGT